MPNNRSHLELLLPIRKIKSRSPLSLALAVAIFLAVFAGWSASSSAVTAVWLVVFAPFGAPRLTPTRRPRIAKRAARQGRISNTLPGLLPPSRKAIHRVVAANPSTYSSGSIPLDGESAPAHSQLSLA